MKQRTARPLAKAAALVAAGALAAFGLAACGGDNASNSNGESTEGKGSYEEKTIALGDTSPAGLLRKARFVLEEMERRMAALGGGWGMATASQIYTIHDIHPFLGEELVRRGIAILADEINAIYRGS